MSAQDRLQAYQPIRGNGRPPCFGKRLWFNALWASSADHRCSETVVHRFGAVLYRTMTIGTLQDRTISVVVEPMMKLRIRLWP